jgi:5'-nucleotidase
MSALRVVPLVLLLLAGPAHAEPVTITLLHLNDVYEITRPGKRDLGGLTRVATLQKQLRARSANMVSILAGDFFAPSALGTAKVDGERLDGKHMVAVLNAMKLDFATFGNHEFDVPEKAFLARLGEARFGWFSGNITDAKGQPFPGVAPYRVLTFKGPGWAVHLALLGLTIETGRGNKNNYWRYSDYLETARRQVRHVREVEGAEVVVAVTHLNLDDDIRLAREVPGIDLILGGHEHENNAWRSRTPGQPPILKADANVRTVYVHNLRFDPLTRQLDTESQLLAVTNQIAEDPDTAAVVDDWVNRGFAALEKAAGRSPRDVVLRTRIDLEGRDAYVRHGKTNLTEVVGRALRSAVKDSDLAVYNSGLIRIDDLIPAGPLTYYDVLRILPYGGNVHAAEVRGRMLARLFDRGMSPDLHGDGAFLQASGVEPGKWAGEWLVGGKPLDPQRVYRVAINGYLLEGREEKLAFLGERKGDVKDLGKRADLREAVIAQLQKDVAEPAHDEASPPAADSTAEKRWPPPWWLAGLVGAVAGAVVVGLLTSRRPR